MASTQNSSHKSTDPATKSSQTATPATEAKHAAVAATAQAAKAKSEAAAAAAAKIAGGQANGFVNFVRQQGVIGLAVGLAIGTAAGATVKTIVDQLIAPIVALITRGVDLNKLRIIIVEANPAQSQPEVAIGYGLILSSLITLLATALVIYIVVHLLRLDRLDKKKDA